MAGPAATSRVSLLTLLISTLTATGAGGVVGPLSPGPDPSGPPPTGPTGPIGPTGPPGCANVICPRPLCADPVTPPGSCCPSCAQSKCRLEGCVQLRPQLRWLPEPCKICFCINGRTQCGAIGCLPLFPESCFGYPIIPVGSTPSVCCPRCDFGVPETSCKAVPFQTKPFTISHGTSTCSGEILQQKCDKAGFRRGGKLFRCEPRFTSRFVSVSGRGCDPFTQGRELLSARQR